MGLIPVNPNALSSISRVRKDRGMMSSYDTKGRDYVNERMPMIGVGTWQIRDKDIIAKMLDAAFSAGYRFIDTAQVYGNERTIGALLPDLLKKHNLTREQIFITTKLSPDNQGAKKADAAVKKSLQDLGVDYVDLVLIHWPGSSRTQPSSPLNSALRRESWTVLEDIYEKRLARAIGVSNYNEKHLRELSTHMKVLPAVNQCEFSVIFQPHELMECCKQMGIHFQMDEEDVKSLISSSARTRTCWDPDTIQ